MWSELPIVQAPMAGGPSTPELAAAVSAAGGLGFLAAGYKSAAAMRAEIDRTRELTSRPFGTNVFMPSRDAVDPAAVAAYRARLAPEAERLGAALGTPDPAARDDGYDAKIAELLESPPDHVSFTFGTPSRDVVRALQGRHVTVVVTVTSVDEALQASQTSGADALCLQGSEAGGHRASFTNTRGEGLPVRELLAAVRAAVPDRPLIAAGGLATRADVAELLGLGAVAVQAGTVFVRCTESGASAVHRAALADPRFTSTAVTRAFSGRPARGLVNRFLTEHDAHAPAAYPDVHFVTSPLRKAAAAAGDADAVNLWAGTSWRHAPDASAAAIVRSLAG
ncbi:nitronate monooxygenase family protein [Actinomadura sp. WMMB 499]|uniref:NAD(P)H-dependent flavin oxidoreductase n=1 Tax=Actinomadura sp. WMMB 499 TaxID=1219491 RepID=UPI001249273F|nr:nitronate monooxygenase [Actinomadura sp. WMMB 499]QFG22672.1 nitronate monooxygenase [Actinomadura sp. WMMB 499]